MNIRNLPASGRTPSFQRTAIPTNPGFPRPRNEPGQKKKAAVNVRSIIQAARTGRLESSWRSTPYTADDLIYQAWTATTARARQAYEEFDHYRKFAQLVRANVVGENGMNLNAQIRDPSGSVDTRAIRAIEGAYYDFSKKGNFDVSGTLSRADAERMALNTWATDGEVIVVKRYGKQFPHGIAFQFIDPVRLDPIHYMRLPNGNHIRHGIEMDEDNRPLRYYFRKSDERGCGYLAGYGPNDFTVVDARDVIHWFVPEKPGQKRGICPGRTALSRMRMLSGFEDAAIINARIGSSKMGFFHNPDAEGGADDEDLVIDADPGSMEDIGNRELVKWDPQFPDAAIETFIRTILRSIGAGLSVSYHNLSNDLTSVNFSSIRQGTLDERSVWRSLQDSFVEGVCRPMFEAWLEFSVLVTGSILINEKPLRVDSLEKYKAVDFIGTRWAWIDPSSDQSANERAVSQGFKSRSQVIRETSNRDPEEVFAEIEAENKELARRGIIPALPPGVTLPPEEEAPAPAGEPIQK
ncbi:MAG: phage portal protein [Verrucomicrobium sp.]|nr:phage portal protein [Verrucomicrobium sp.]